jgi:hypothetical protein
VTDALTVQSGELVVLRLFDVADGIDLSKAEEQWRREHGESGVRSRLSTTPPNAVAFGVPPLVLPLPVQTIRYGGRESSAGVRARLYDFGVIAVSLHVEVRDLRWSEFAASADALDHPSGELATTEFWMKLVDNALRPLAGAIHRSTSEMIQEDYMLGIVRAFDRPVDAETIKSSLDLCRFLSGESRPLAASQQRDLLQRTFSYLADDLVALTWDRAFIYEPRDDSDVADIIEVANAQLVEFRYYDELLDRELPRMYERISAAQRAVSLFAAHRLAQLARLQYRLVAEVTELRERVDNALQVTEDVYLARVYAASLDAFRVASVSAAVDRKLAIMRDTYSALYDEASSRRAEILEIAIIALIVIEIVLALAKH